MGEVIKIDRGVDLYANKSEALEICEAIYLATCEFFDDEPRLTVPTSMTEYVQSRMQDLKDAGDNTSLIEYNAKKEKHV